MGKNKKKGRTKLSEDSGGVDEKSPTTANAPVVEQALDGHNVQGWTESQIRAYNELLAEREKLEKQRKDLEQRSAKSQAGRALLNEGASNIDTVFKPQKSSGGYLYVGSTHCCVEIDTKTKCHHEICRRAKSSGLTYTELDTIKYYHMRMLSEKSDRMRNALRKQRDLELLKIKKDEDDEKAKASRKSALRRNSIAKGESATSRSVAGKNVFDNALLSGATKETQRLVTNILEQLDHLRAELQNGQITGTEMQKQLDIIDAEMQAAHLKTKTLKNAPAASFMPALSGSRTDSSALSTASIKDLIADDKTDTYTKAFHIMENFLSATRPGDFQLAISELKNVLRLNGPMCEELQTSFDALEGIFDSPDRLSFTGPDGKQECTSIIDLMEKMKDTLNRTGRLPEGANSDLTKVFQDCIDLEMESKKQLWMKYDKCKADASCPDLEPILSEVRATYVSKSPIPPLTEKTLEAEVALLLGQYDAHVLISKAKNGLEDVALEGYITALVMNRANKDPEKYIEAIQRLAAAYEAVGDNDGCQAVTNALPKVRAKMELFIAKLEEKKAKDVLALQKQVEPPALIEDEVKDTADLLEHFPTNTADIVADAIKKMTDRDSNSDAHLALRSLISSHGTSGLWPIWLLFAEETDFAEDHGLQEKSRGFENEIDRLMTTGDGGLKKVILFLHQSGTCPGLCAAVVSEILASASEFELENIPNYVQELADCMEDISSFIDYEWSRAFHHLAFAMVQLYTALHVNAASLYPESQPSDFAFSTMAMVTTYVCLMSSATLALNNLQLMHAFLNACTSPDGLEPVTEIDAAIGHYEMFCRDDRFRCLSTGPCRNHFPTDADLIDEVDTLQDDSTTLGSKVPSGGNYPDLQSESHSSSHRTRASLIDSTIKSAPQVVHPKSRIEERHAILQNRAGTTEFDENTGGRAGSTENNIISGMIDDQRQHSKSRFSEHIDERSTSRVTEPSESAQRQGLFFEGLDLSGRLTASQISEAKKVIRQTKANVLSGQVSNPLAAFSRAVSGLSKDTEMPEELRSMCLNVKQEIKDFMEHPHTHFVWTTRRMRSIISFDGNHDSPSPTALFDLAQSNFSAFEEYAALLAHEKARRNQSAAYIKKLCDDVYDMMTDGILDADANHLKTLSSMALDDWDNRDAILQAQQSKGASSDVNGGSVSKIVSASGTPIFTSRNRRQDVSDQVTATIRKDQTKIFREPLTSTNNNQSVIIRKMQQFLTNLKDLERTRDEIVSFTFTSSTSADTDAAPSGKTTTSATRQKVSASTSTSTSMSSSSHDADQGQSKVFDDLIGALSQTRKVIMDVAKVVAEHRNLNALQKFVDQQQM